MSGGYFDYKQYSIQQTADELRNFIDKIESGFIDKWGINFAENYGKQEILDKFKLTLDYLISGDTGEDSFLKKAKELGLSEEEILILKS